MSDSNKPSAFAWTGVVVSIAAMAATSVNPWSAYHSFSLNREAQKTALFSQFQQEYASISGRFPTNYLDQGFMPKRGSEDYGKLEAYWIFCFAEWYATQKLNNDAYGYLWSSYYSPLIADGMSISSLRYVLSDMMADSAKYHGLWTEFFDALRAIAQTNNVSLAPTVQPASAGGYLTRRCGMTREPEPCRKARC